MFPTTRSLLRFATWLVAVPLLVATVGCGAGETGATEGTAEVDEREPLLSRIMPTREETLEVPAGAQFSVAFSQTVSSETAAAGDTFHASVVDGVRVDGKVAIPEGSVIIGTVTEAVPTRRIGGQAKLALDFHTLELPGGETKQINALIALEGQDQSGRDAATIAGGAVGGAILGRVIGGGDRKKRSLLGLAIGAAAGTAIAAAGDGDPVEIPEGTVLPLVLEEPVTVKVRG